MINYTEKGGGLHSEIEKAGYSLREENGVWVSSNDIAVQAIIDSYTLLKAASYRSSLVDEHAERLRNKFMKGISFGESSSWASKKIEADKFQISKSNADAPSIVLEASHRGVTVQSLVNKILSKFDDNINRESRIAGVAGKHKDAIKASLTFDDISAYDYSTDWPSE